MLRNLDLGYVGVFGGGGGGKLGVGLYWGGV